MARAPAQRRTTKTALSAPKAMAMPDESAASLPGSSKVRLRLAAAAGPATIESEGGGCESGGGEVGDGGGDDGLRGGDGGGGGGGGGSGGGRGVKPPLSGPHLQIASLVPPKVKLHDCTVAP